MSAIAETFALGEPLALPALGAVPLQLLVPLPSLILGGVGFGCSAAAAALQHEIDVRLELALHGRTQVTEETHGSCRVART